MYAREVVSADVHADSRWPELRTRLSAQVRAVAGTPIMLGGSPVGTLNAYRDEPVEWDKSDVNALIAYSGLIAEVLATALAAQEHGIVASQLQYALDYRVVIERAVGYLMGTHRLDAVTAFDVLRKRARDSRRRVADVATEILGGSTGPASDDRVGDLHPSDLGLAGLPRPEPTPRRSPRGELPSCLQGGAQHGKLALLFRRVSADRTFGGDDLWHIGFASAMSSAPAGRFSFRQRSR